MILIAATKFLKKINIKNNLNSKNIKELAYFSLDNKNNFILPKFNSNENNQSSIKKEISIYRMNQE